jgi:putative membrane protein
MAVVAVAISGRAGAQTSATSEADKTFLHGQQETNLAEISLGKVAMERATSQAVRTLAAELVAGHEQVLEQNRALHTKLGLTEPTTPSAEQLATAEKVKAASGAAFDAAYVTAQVEGHTKSVSKAQQAASSATNADIKAFATDYAPKAQMHLERAQAVQADLNSTQTATLPRTGASSGMLSAAGLALALLGLTSRSWARRSKR